MSLTFVIGTSGLNTSIDEYYPTEQEWVFDDLPANVQWEKVTVSDEQARSAWIAAMNQWLEACWTPNQDRETRQENAVIMREAEATMQSLEVVSR